MSRPVLPTLDVSLKDDAIRTSDGRSEFYSNIYFAIYINLDNRKFFMKYKEASPKFISDQIEV